MAQPWLTTVNNLFRDDLVIEDGADHEAMVAREARHGASQSAADPPQADTAECPLTRDVLAGVLLECLAARQRDSPRPTTAEDDGEVAERQRRRFATFFYTGPGFDFGVAEHARAFEQQPNTPIRVPDEGTARCLICRRTVAAHPSALELAATKLPYACIFQASGSRGSGVDVVSPAFLDVDRTFIGAICAMVPVAAVAWFVFWESYPGVIIAGLVGLLLAGVGGCAFVAFGSWIKLNFVSHPNGLAFDKDARRVTVSTRRKWWSRCWSRSESFPIDSVRAVEIVGDATASESCVGHLELVADDGTCHRIGDLFGGVPSYLVDKFNDVLSHRREEFLRWKAYLAQLKTNCEGPLLTGSPAEARHAIRLMDATSVLVLKHCRWSSEELTRLREAAVSRGAGRPSSVSSSVALAGQGVDLCGACGRSIAAHSDQDTLVSEAAAMFVVALGGELPLSTTPGPHRAPPPSHTRPPSNLPPKMLPRKLRQKRHSITPAARCDPRATHQLQPADADEWMFVDQGGKLAAMRLGFVVGLGAMLLAVGAFLYDQRNLGLAHIPVIVFVVLWLIVADPSLTTTVIDRSGQVSTQTLRFLFRCGGKARLTSFNEKSRGFCQFLQEWIEPVRPPQTFPIGDPASDNVEAAAPYPSDAARVDARRHVLAGCVQPREALLDAWLAGTFAGVHTPTRGAASFENPLPRGYTYAQRHVVSASDTASATSVASSGFERPHTPTSATLMLSEHALEFMAAPATDEVSGKPSCAIRWARKAPLVPVAAVEVVSLAAGCANPMPESCGHAVAPACSECGQLVALHPTLEDLDAEGTACRELPDGLTINGVAHGVDLFEQGQRSWLRLILFGAVPATAGLVMAITLSDVGGMFGWFVVSCFAVISVAGAQDFVATDESGALTETHVDRNRGLVRHWRHRLLQWRPQYREVPFDDLELTDGVLRQQSTATSSALPDRPLVAATPDRAAEPPAYDATAECKLRSYVWWAVTPGLGAP